MLCHPERSEAESKDPVALSLGSAAGFLRPSLKATASQATSLGMTTLARLETFCSRSMEISGILEGAT